MVIDQATKWIISSSFVQGESIPVIGNFFYLTYVKNPGAAFGLFLRMQWLLPIVGFGAIILVFLFRRQISQQSLLVKWGICISLGGAIGNLIDRIRFGAVIDFIDFRIWPIFNFADIAIVGGVALLFWEVLTDGRKQSSE